jgi:hypothetical protein
MPVMRSFSRGTPTRAMYSADSGSAHVIAVHGAAEPQRVNVVIRYHDGVTCAQFPFRNQPRDDFRGKKMRGDAKIRLPPLEHPNHRLRVQAIHGQPSTRMVPRLVGPVLDHAHEFGDAPHPRDVGFLVDALLT